jgi:acetate---CoA ligase (ADP-forming)
VQYFQNNNVSVLHFFVFSQKLKKHIDMINEFLLKPSSIAVIGASNDVKKPGGKVLKNILDNNFEGQVFAVNPKEKDIQGVQVYSHVNELPQTDLAIIAIAAKYCLETVRELAYKKNTKAYIILSAGFSEESHEGKELEDKIIEIINDVDGCLIGPNCIGVITPHHASAFTTPIPDMDAQGIDFISGSGATAVFIMESGIPKGLKFSSVYSVGNSAQTGVEEILEYLDIHYVDGESSKIKLLYLETISKPQKLLKHASSLISKGCKIAAIKAGSSEAGSRAASSHTGALASSDVAVDALFRKAGIVRCGGREELAAVASVFMHKELHGKRIAIVTHAGGPAVMLTDALSNGGLEIPSLKDHTKAQQLLDKLYPGSSVANPIDFLATGTAEQLGHIIDACENDFDEIDGIAVIFGSPGLFKVYDVYDILHEKMKTCKKPIYPILPSVINVKNEIDYFIQKGNVFFPDEVVFANALCKVVNTNAPSNVDENDLPQIDKILIRKVINDSQNGYISPEQLSTLLDGAGIPRVQESVCDSKECLISCAQKMGFPLVMKVVGPVHKSDVGGVVLNVQNEERLIKEFERMMQIPETTAILLQTMASGMELFLGAKREDGFGHVILCGMGGIFVEVIKDVNAGLSPLSKVEALEMIQNLKSYKLIQGIRGKEGIDEHVFADIISRLSALMEAAPEIFEMDLNPLLGIGKQIIAVDARCRIER